MTVSRTSGINRPIAGQEATQPLGSENRNLNFNPKDVLKSSYLSELIDDVKFDSTAVTVTWKVRKDSPRANRMTGVTSEEQLVTELATAISKLYPKTVDKLKEKAELESKKAANVAARKAAAEIKPFELKVSGATLTITNPVTGETKQADAGFDIQSFKRLSVNTYGTYGERHHYAMDEIKGAFDQQNFKIEANNLEKSSVRIPELALVAGVKKVDGKSEVHIRCLNLEDGTWHDVQFDKDLNLEFRESEIYPVPPPMPTPPAFVPKAKTVRDASSQEFERYNRELAAHLEFENQFEEYLPIFQEWIERPEHDVKKLPNTRTKEGYKSWLYERSDNWFDEAGTTIKDVPNTFKNVKIPIDSISLVAVSAPRPDLSGTQINFNLVSSASLSTRAIERRMSAHKQTGSNNDLRFERINVGYWPQHELSELNSRHGIATTIACRNPPNEPVVSYSRIRVSFSLPTQKIELPYPEVDAHWNKEIAKEKSQKEAMQEVLQPAKRRSFFERLFGR